MPFRTKINFEVEKSSEFQKQLDHLFKSLVCGPMLLCLCECVGVCVFTNCDTRLNAISQQVRVINFFFYPTGVQRSLTTSLLKINYLFAIDLSLSEGNRFQPIFVPMHLMVC